MKICFFAHKPPPYHGQSIAVETLINGLQDERGTGNSEVSANSSGPATGNCEIQVYHVDARLSDDVDEIGGFQIKKLFRIGKYVCKALWIRFRYGVKNLYYVPAPGLKAAVYRDWIVMAVCRPFYSKIIYHFQAVGLGEWVTEKSGLLERRISKLLYRKVDLCLALSDFYKEDILKLNPQKIATTPNGVPDPCPDFETSLLTTREQQWELINGENSQLVNHGQENENNSEVEIKILYLSLCYSEKGLFDALDAVKLFNQQQHQTQKGQALRARLTVAGKFYLDSEREKFELLARSPDYQFQNSENGGDPDSMVKYVGFAYDEKKDRLFRENDLFIFPTYYAMEGHPLCLLEALGYGMPTITTFWRAVPDIYQEDQTLLVRPKDIEGLAAAIKKAIHQPKEIFRNYRTRFLQHYSKETYIRNVKKAMLSLECTERQEHQ